MLITTSNRYGSISKFFHWIIFLLVFVMIFLGYFMGDVTDKALRGAVSNIHKIIGISILLLMILRGVWALLNPKPVVPNVSGWERALERVWHFYLYLLLLAMPIVGWVGSVAKGKDPHLFGKLLSLPVPQNKLLGDFLFDIHGLLAIFIIAFVSIHVLAALYHHYVKKDNVLIRMLP